MITAPSSRVLCVIDHLHRDVGIADAVVRGEFTHCGVTAQLPMPPTWTVSPIADEEWRIEWVKGYEGLDLAYAFSQEPAEAYASTWMLLVSSFCEQVPVGHDSSDVSARRMQNWLYTWQRFTDSPEFPGFPDSFVQQLTARLRQDADHLADNLTAARNHRTLEIYSLLLLGIAFQDSSRAQCALEILADNAETDIGDDGVQCELSTDYHGIVLRSLVGAIANARRVALTVPDRLVARTSLAATVAMHWQRPDGITPAVSDGDEADFRPLLSLAAEVLGRADLLFAATEGIHGERPTETCPTFPVGGYAVQRSGWGTTVRSYAHEWWALMDIGPIGAGGHGHYDQLSVLLYANGQPITVDPGRYSYDEEPEGWRRTFKGTAAHNTITVDGSDQIPFRRGKPKGPQSTARLLQRDTRLDAHGTLHDTLVGEVISPSYPAVHIRSLHLDSQTGWRVVDNVRSSQSHRFDLRWHLPATATGRTTLTQCDGGALIETPYGHFTITATASGASATAGSMVQGVSARVEQGWVSPTYGVKLPAPVIVATVHGAEATLITHVTPR